METKSELFVVSGIKVRQVKHNIYVRENGWKQYLEFNKVRSASFAPSLLSLTLR